MLTQKMTLAACIGVMGIALLASNANAMTEEECTHLEGNQFLAAVERGACGIDIVTAAGPQETSADDGRDGRNGGGNHGGGDRPKGGGGGNPGGGRAAGKP
jgi:uncharacterized membrane protein YgcG